MKNTIEAIAEASVLMFLWVCASLSAVGLHFLLTGCYGSNESEPNLMVTLDEPGPKLDLTAIAPEDLPLQIKEHELTVIGAGIDISVPTLVPNKSGKDCLVSGGRLEVAEEISLLAVRLEYDPPEIDSAALPNLCSSEQEIIMTWRDLFLLSVVNANAVAEE